MAPGFRRRQVSRILAEYGILEVLAPFRPVLAGTIPLGLDLPDSDADLLCEARDRPAFEHVLRTSFEARAGYTLRRRPGDPWSVVCAFDAGGLTVEIFGQPLEPRRQAAYRHMVVEGRLLRLAGEPLRRAVLALKRDGWKTEPAFAHLLGLPGDPYAALLKLEEMADSELAALMAHRGILGGA